MTGTRSWVRATALVSALVLSVLTGACSDDGGGGDGGPGGDESAGLQVEVASSRPEYVTGGEALVAVTLPPGVDPASLTVTAGDRDVTDAFAAAPEPGRAGAATATRGTATTAPGTGTTVATTTTAGGATGEGAAGRLVGLVEGLEEGETEVTARVGDDEAAVTITANPTSGPLFSGEQLPLYACSTEVFGLAPSTPEDDCAAPTVVTWQYVDGAGVRHDLADPTRPPADAATVEVGGEEVPFVLRTETGVLNRSVYRVTLLEPHPEPGGAPDMSGWNGRLVYRFGGGCGASFTQGYFFNGAMSLELLERGYAAAGATFNTFQVLCNDLISAETASMVKEHFTEAYGEPVHTIGEGGSGGAIQQVLLAQNYPGLLDGIAPLIPFPDALTISPGVYDCSLLRAYYATPGGLALDEGQRRAVNGHATAGTCDLWATVFGPTIDAINGCGTDFSGVVGAGEARVPTIPQAERYHPETNPDGWRCTVWETNVAITGRDPDTGHARSGYDNQGVQYGLDALNAGVIDAEEFVALNEGIGGFDADGQRQDERSAVGEGLAARAFTTGRVAGPWGGLPETPMILVNAYNDPRGDIHDRVRSFSLLDRLAAEDGSWPGTASLWTFPVPADAGMADTLTGSLGDTVTAPVLALDEWLTAAEAEAGPGTGDDRPDDWAEVLARTKPDSAESRCILPDGRELVGPDANADAACEEAFPIAEEPRMAAGAPRANDVIKCRLVPLDEARDQYEVELSGDQLDRLAAVFPDGVCDWTQPSVGYGPPDGTWLDLTEE